MSSTPDKTLRHILLDIGFPLKLETVKIVIEAIQNVSSLLCHTEEPAYGSLLSISIINSEFQMVLKSTKCKTGLGKIIAALNDVKLLAGTCYKPTERAFFDALHVAYVKVIEDLRTESISENFWVENPDVQICVITQKNGTGIRINLENHLKSGKLPKPTRNLVVELSADSSESSVCGSSFVEFYKIPPSKENLQNFFKQFLLNSGNGRELIHLDLPGISLKCEIIPIMLSPNYLPTAHHYSLQRLPNSDWHKKETISDSHPPMGRRLMVLNRLSSSGLGETQIFGEPTLIVPSSRNNFVDEDSYATNLQVMKTLENSLNAKDEWLVAKLNSEPSGFFVLMPGDNLFLAKPVISAELRLPGQFNTNISVDFDENRAEVAKIKVARSLASLKVEDELKEEENISGLYKILLKMKIPKPSKENSESFNCWTPKVDTPENNCRKRAKKKVESPIKYYKMFKK